MQHIVPHDKERIAETIMAINPTKNRTMHPKSHYGLHPYFLEMRYDLYLANTILKNKRKNALKLLYQEDMKRDDEELRMIGKAYMINQR